jgi:hypothetical protein
MCREPVSEIKNDTGEEAGLGHAEQEAHGIEARRAADQRHGDRDQAPAHHDARDPDARTKVLKGEVARDLEQ